MRLHLFEYTCGRCQFRFKAPELLDGYGELLLRSVGLGSEAIVDALHDDTFKEVGELVRSLPIVDSLPAWRTADVVQAVFGTACDLDADGTEFEVGGEPRCPNCGSHTMECWQSTEPPELVDLEAPHVTHERWLAKTRSERQELIRMAVADRVA